MNNQETKIPLALINLKEGAGENWPVIKKCLCNFLDIKRELKNSNLPLKTKKNLELIVFNCYLTNPLTFGYFNYVNASMSKRQIVSHYKNVICALHRMEYNSGVMCFIIDGYNTKIYSQKKYPQFN